MALLGQRTSASAEHLADHNTIHALMPTGESNAIKTKAGVPADADFPATPPNGTVAFNSSTNVLYIRLAGAWIAHASGGYSTVQDEGTGLTARSTVDFTGAGVTATDTGSKTQVAIPGGGTTGYATVQDEGSALTQRTALNFVGAGVTAADTGSITDVTIPGGTTGSLNWINVKDSPYSATGNGTTDDRAAIQSAYNALPNTVSTTTSVGGVLYFPPGVYKIGSPGLDFTTVKPVWILGAQGVSTFRSANRAAVKWTTGTGNYSVIQLGPEVLASAYWYGFRVENIFIHDTSGTNTEAGIWLAAANYAYFQNVAVSGFLAGTAVRQRASQYNPQYATFMKCNFGDFKYGLYQDAQSGGTGTDFYNSDTELYGCTFHGLTDNATAVQAGSIGIKSYRTLRMFGGAVQQCETAISLNEANNKLIGTAFENTGGVVSTVGVDVVAGAGNVIAFCDWSGAYSTAKLRIQAAASNTQVRGWLHTGGGTNLVDNGTNSMIDGPVFGYKTRRRTTGELTAAVAVDHGAGTQMFNTSTNKPVWSDGAVFRYADGTTV